jgi:beta-barrel assembly-enhancing protease
MGQICAAGCGQPLLPLSCRIRPAGLSQLEDTRKGPRGKQAVSGPIWRVTAGTHAGVHLAPCPGMTRQTRPETLRLLFASIVAVTMTTSAAAQTRIEPHRNSYSPQQDVELGGRAAREVREQLPMVNDGPTRNFVARIGERLVAEIPAELRQPLFRYTFDVVNLKEINAFALPGGPMFLHRGMLEAARTDGEVAGVMAHELSHVILRHGTVQASKGQKFQLGAMAGQVLGSIVGGRTGSVIAQGSQFGLGTYFLKYSREYEREADLLGAQIMARAGYDPREMANMFQTIARQGGGGPEWLSDHPNPGNRQDAINREAAMLRVDGSSRSNAGIESVHARLARMPPAPTTQQVARASQGQRRDEDSRGTSGRGLRIEPPSSRWRTYRPWDFLSLSVPSNWRRIDGEGAVAYAPEGGYLQQNGRSTFTHGIEVGVMEGDGGSLQQRTEQLLQGFARTNPQLRRQGGYARTDVDGHEALTTTLTNVSDVTGDRETVTVSTVRLEDGNVLFLIGVAPQDETRTYVNTFSRVRQSLQIVDN